MNKVERTVKIGDSLVHGVEIDWEKRDRKRIYTPEEEMERREKIFELFTASQITRPSRHKPVTVTFEIGSPSFRKMDTYRTGKTMPRN